MNKQANSNQNSIPKKDDKLNSFIKRIERLLEEKNTINFDIKVVFCDSKVVVYSSKIMRKILRLRKNDIDERLEHEALLNTYRNALGIYQ